jgi:redox-sensitive bicupin YhaK (pirin superfamily)
MANVELVIDGRRKDLGGFEISRVLPYARRRMVGPFIFFDHIGPADFAPGHGVTVRPHPHIGLSTVTYLFEGSMHHRDSLGFDQVIVPGEVNWMTAGRGITHSERTDPEVEATGSRMHGIQAWVALPDALEEQAPAFANHKDGDLPSYESGGLAARLIAGEAFGAKAAVKTSSPMFYVHWELQPGAKAQLPAEYPERAAYVASGEVEIDGQRAVAGQMLVFAPGQPVVFEAVKPSIVMLLGGEPIGERFIEWNFVASSKERLEQAKADWRAGRFALPPTDNKEWIPLPADEPPPPPEPAS